MYNFINVRDRFHACYRIKSVDGICLSCILASALAGQKCGVAIRVFTIFASLQYGWAKYASLKSSPT